MTLTPDDLQNLVAVLKGGQDRTNSGILDALMKVAVGVCTAGVLWLLNTTTTVSTNVATMQAQQPGTEPHAFRRYQRAEGSCETAACHERGFNASPGADGSTAYKRGERAETAARSDSRS
jgi:hypothetical protein